MLSRCTRLIQRLLHTLAYLKLSTDFLLRSGLPPLLFMLRSSLAWLVPHRFLPSSPDQPDHSPPYGRVRSNTIYSNFSTLLQRRKDTLPMHVGDNSASSTLNVSTSQKGTHDDPGYPRSQSLEQEINVFAIPASSSPVLEPAGLKAMPEGEEIESGEPQHPNLSGAVPDLVAVTSDEYQRYSRNATTDRFFWDKFIIDALETDFSRPKTPNQWKHYTHPDGVIYYLNELWQIPVITDVYVDEEGLRTRLEDFIEKIFSYITSFEIKMPAECCLVLEFRLSNRCGYYFVDHSTRCLFWLEEIDASFGFLDLVKVKYTPPLVGHEMKSLYWLHNEYFPELRPFMDDALQEIKDVLIHAVGDSLTSPSSLSPYKLDDLQRMLSLVKDIESSHSRGPGSAAVVYRLLHNFCHERFLHLHGEKVTRLNTGVSIHPARSRTFVIKILSPLLLFGPEVHLRKLVEISVDSLVRMHDWEKMLEELTNDWKEFTLYSTVLLNANIAFLQISSVDTSCGQSCSHYRSAQQRMSYFSVVTSIGAIALGLLLVRQHTTTLDLSFITDRSASMMGLETLSVMYSLPYALLMWGMVSFLAAFSIMCFRSGDIFTIIMMSLTCFILFLLLLWSVTVAYEDRPFWHAWLFRKLSRSWVLPKGIIQGEGRLRDSSSKNYGSLKAS